MKRSSQSENSKYSILVNELTRRFEVMDKGIDIEEKIEVIDHFSQQLMNSGCDIEQIRDIVQSSLKGIQRKQERRKGLEFMFRSGESTLKERLNKCLLGSTSWFRETEKEKNRY